MSSADNTPDEAYILRVEGFDKDDGDCINETVTFQQLPRVVPRSETDYLEINVVAGSSELDNANSNNGSTGDMHE